MKTLNQYILESLKGYKPSTIDTKKHKEQLPEDCTEYFANQKVDVDDIENLDTSNVMYMEYMFSGATFNQTSLDLSSWDVSKVENIEGMFSCCDSLKALDLSTWDVSNLIHMKNIFEECRHLEYIDLSGWDVSNVIDDIYIFCNCYSLTNIIFGPGWGKSNADNIKFILCDCGEDKGYKLSDETYESMLTMYDRKKAGLSPVTIYFNKRHNIPDGFKKQMEARGYIIELK